MGSIFIGISMETVADCGKLLVLAHVGAKDWPALDATSGQGRHQGPEYSRAPATPVPGLGRVGEGPVVVHGLKL